MLTLGKIFFCLGSAYDVVRFAVTVALTLTVVANAGNEVLELEGYPVYV